MSASIKFLFVPFPFLFLLFSIGTAILIQSNPGTGSRQNVRFRVPNQPDQGIIFRALLPERGEQCLTEDLADNRLFLDLPGCRLSLDWSRSLFGTTYYYRPGQRPSAGIARRSKRRWRVGPVQKLKLGSGIAHLGNHMRVRLTDSSLTVASVSPEGLLMGAQQAKSVKCPLGLASSGGVLDMDVFSSPKTSKCQIAIEFDNSYQLLATKEVVPQADGAAAEGNIFELEMEAMKD